MAGTIKIQQGATASTPVAGYTTIWTSSTDGEVYRTKPDGSSAQLGVSSTSYGAFLSTVSQTNAGATAANVLTYNTTDFSSGVSIVDTTKITLQNSGIHNIQFSAQLKKSSGGEDDIDIWLAKNGSAVANSNTRITLSGNPGYGVAAWNFLVDVDAGDYFQIYWSSADTTAEIHADAAGTNPTRPAIPSVILSVVGE